MCIRVRVERVGRGEAELFGRVKHMPIRFSTMVSGVLEADDDSWW